MDGNRFADKVVVVTGGGFGIGAATAYRLAREGATVIAVERTEDTLKAAAVGAPAGSTIVTRAADVSDEPAITALWRARDGRERVMPLCRERGENRWGAGGAGRARCAERSPGGGERTGTRPGQVRRRSGADRPDVQTRP